MIKWLINELKTDFGKIKLIFTGKAKLKVPIGELFQDVGKTFTDHKMFFLVVLLAFFCGWFVAGKIYQDSCNKHVVNTFFPENISASPCLDYCEFYDKVNSKSPINFEDFNFSRTLKGS